MAVEWSENNMEDRVFLLFYDGTGKYMDSQEYEKTKFELSGSGKTGDIKNAKIPEDFHFREHYWTHNVYVP